MASYSNTDTEKKEIERSLPPHFFLSEVDGYSWWGLWGTVLHPVVQSEKMVTTPEVVVVSWTQGWWWGFPSHTHSLLDPLPMDQWLNSFNLPCCIQHWTTELETFPRTYFSQPWLSFLYRAVKTWREASLLLGYKRRPVGSYMRKGLNEASALPQQWSPGSLSTPESQGQ